MKKLYIGLTFGILTFTIFSFCQNTFAQIQKKATETEKAKVENSNTMIANSEIAHKIADIEKYVILNQKYIDASQKNLDLWLKYLSFVLSVLIGYSIFNGLRMREIAKDELKEIKALKDEIKKVATDAESRLESVFNQIKLIETSANNAKKIEEQMSLQLEELSNSEEKTLSAVQSKNLDKIILKAQEQLQNTGIDAIKNLYLAKSIKARDEGLWEDLIRLMTQYIDLDDENVKVFGRRGFAYQKISQTLTDELEKFKLEEKSLADYNNVILLDPKSAVAYNNKGNILLRRKKYTEALIEYNKAIDANPNYSLAYSNRALVYKKLENLDDANKDLAKAAELNKLNGT